MREHHRSRVKHYKGKYAERAREEEQELKVKTIRQGQRSLKLVETVKNYSNYVYEHFKPKTVSKTNP
jgi:hypothetical protein